MGEVPGGIGDDMQGWLAAALAGFGTLSSVEVTSIGQGEGFVGQLGRVALDWADSVPDAPSSVVVKLPTDDPGGRAVGQMMGMYERESRFYRELADTVPVRVPRCYANVADPATDTWALVLEDLAPLACGDQVAGADAERAGVVVEHLARFHATFYGRPLLDQLDWIPTLVGPMTAAIVPMFEASWVDFQDEYRGRVSSRALDWIERFAPQVPTFLDGYVDLPTTVSHGDFRLDNMFFGDDDEFALVDWQMSMRVPGSSDLVYFLVTNLEPEVRRAHEWDLIDRYLETLRAEGVGEDLLSRDTVVRGYREGTLLFGVMFVSTMTMERANPRGEAFFEALVGRTTTAIDDLESGAMFGL
jgi:aminoglycoside phosphotransferase (APT) family kinase protein